MASEQIEIFGAREHNLQVDHLVIPKNALVVLTGPSGSGKSSLAFDTLYAEGQRRYVESLSAYARQFLGRLDRPAVEKLKGLSPTIAIEQKSASGNPRSTVGTITEIHDYLRVLFARAGTQHCHVCGKVVAGRSVDEIVRDALALGPALSGTRGAPAEKVLVLAPVAKNRKGEFKDVLDTLRSRGFLRVRLDGRVARLDEDLAIDKKKKHDLEVVIDRVTLSSHDRRRLAEAVELGLRTGHGEIRIEPEGDASAGIDFSESRQCCGVSYPALSPQSFSFNSPLGMCPKCSGLGTVLEIDPDLIVPDPSLSIRAGAIQPWATSVERGEGWTFRIIEAMSKATGVDLDVPWKRLPAKQRRQVLYGLEGGKVRVQWGKEGSESHGSWAIKFHGVIPTLMRRYQETSSEKMREQYAKYLRDLPCDACEGRRMRPESLSVKVAGKSIADISSLSVGDTSAFFRALSLPKSQSAIAEGVLREIHARLGFLLNVGLEYLTLDRSATTLSGGEAQRIRLASQLGSELSGVMYVLDEPSIGLHARDNERLLRTLEGLRDLGNSVLVVEHDEETIRAADHVVDFGPGAGSLGGHVVFSGPPSALATEAALAKSETAQFLQGVRRIEGPTTRRPPRGAITIKNAREHNLKGIDVSIPLGVLVGITGVSGAGKSSLVNGILLPGLSRALHRASDPVGLHDTIEGIANVDKIVAIDQHPIGRTPRSNPGTYTKAFDEIRSVFAQLPEAKARGFEASRFSFNLKGGRCEACQGDGVVKVEMHFLSDVYVTCEVCNGRRYNDETLAVRFKGKSISDVLDTSIEECRTLFAAHPPLARILQTLVEVGLGYMKIGQPATTVSGGEAQRIKLSRELARTHTGRTLYVLDEPTTGLHFSDVERLLGVLQRLVEQGNSVLVIEHHLDVIRTCDWLIDLGPEGGEGGGRVIAEGTPEEVARVKGSHTGKFLAPLVSEGARPARGSQRQRPDASDVRAEKREKTRGSRVARRVQTGPE
jgi:excinuclease ABC subunit A